jgi:hypothetical protein
MANPFAPLLSLFGAAAIGKPSKRRRKKNQSKAGGTNGSSNGANGTNGSSTQRSSRALDIIRIQRGLPRNNPSSKTADEVADTQEQEGERPERRVASSPGVHRRPPGERPADAPMLRLSKLISTDTIGLTSDGKRGYVGAQWWARAGRDHLNQIRRRHPAATPDEALSLLLKQTVPSVDWDNAELPRGAQMLSRRLRRLVEASYMGREVDARIPRVTGAPPSQQEQSSGVSTDASLEGIDRPRTLSVPPGFDEQLENAASGDEDGQEEDREESSGLTFEERVAAQGAAGDAHRGTRRGGKRERKRKAALTALGQESAHDAPEDGPEDGNGPETGGGDRQGAGESETASTETDPA